MKRICIILVSVFTAFSAQSQTIDAVSGKAQAADSMTGHSAAIAPIAGNAQAIDPLSGHSPVIAPMAGNAQVIDSMTGTPKAIRPLSSHSPVIAPIVGNAQAIDRVSEITQAIYPLSGNAQKNMQQVSPKVMEEIYQEVKTPYKYGLVMVPSDTAHKMDCPTVFREGKYWYMTYLIYSGRGYETWLARSKDLLKWENQGKLMSFADQGNWDDNQKAGYNALQSTDWGGDYQLGQYDGKYWMSYFGGKEKGYETEPLSIGIAYSTQKPSVVQEWTRLSKPVLTSADADVSWWDNRNKLFKSTIIEDKQRLTGHRFVMYYNAVGDSLLNNKKTRWYERIGMAVSDDMQHWKRFGSNPVVHHPVGITGDGVIQRINGTWVMFYFGAFWQDRKGAFNRFAASKDLVNWTDWQGNDLIRSSEKYDELYAHKSFVLKHQGIVYHFYCAVNKKDQRGIAVATSTNLGKSPVEFIGGNQ